jgi:hypothetical protein
MMKKNKKEALRRKWLTDEERELLKVLLGDDY